MRISDLLKRPDESIPKSLVVGRTYRGMLLKPAETSPPPRCGIKTCTWPRKYPEFAQDFESLLQAHREMNEGLQESDADAFIKHWSFNSESYAKQFQKHRDEFNTALEKYPYRAKSTIYRGMTFNNEADMKRFLSSVKDGQLTETKPTSWSRDKQQAMNFAMLDDEYSLDDEPTYGVVISTVPSLPCIAAYKAPRGENEIIMFPGTISVKLVKSGAITKS